MHNFYFSRIDDCIAMIIKKDAVLVNQTQEADF